MLGHYHLAERAAVRSRRASVLAATALLLLSCLASLPAAGMTWATLPTPRHATAGEGGAVLKPNQPVEREISAGETHHYRTPLDAGQFVRLTVECQGCRIEVTVRAPGGRKLVETILRADDPVPEPVAFVAATEGTHRIELRAGEDGSTPRRYTVSVAELRQATAQDPSRIAAERAFAQGARLQYVKGGPEALRDAAKLYEEALSLWRGAGDREGESLTLGSLGAVYSSLGESRRAIDYYDRKLELVRASRDRRQEALLLETVGWLYYDALADKPNALRCLEQCLAFYRESGPRDAEARLLTTAGRVYSRLGQDPAELEKALDYFNRALEIYRGGGNRYGEGDTLGNLMAVWRSLQKPRLAIFLGKQAVNTFQELRTGIKDLEKDTQKTFLKSKEDVYRSLAELLISEGNLPEAQQVLKMLKEEEYFEYIRGAGDEGGGRASRASLNAEEAQWERRYNEIAGKLTARGRERDELIRKGSRTAEEDRRLAEIEADLTFSVQAFQKFLDRLSEELGGTELARERIFQIQESQGMMEDLRELGPGVVALYTLVGQDKYRVILITSDVQRAFEYPIKAADLARKVAAFREVLQDPERDPLPLAKELYRILIGPVAKDLGDARAETLMWSLDGVLRYLPVAALHDGEKFVVERYKTVVFTPASQTRLKDVPSAKWRGAGFGVSRAYAGFSPLPAVRQELSAIIQDGEAAGAAQGVLPGKVYLDESFTEESLKAALRQRFPVVHIASHFVFKPGSELDSFLLLGDGQRLSLAQVKSSLNFGGVEALTLSACDTATGGGGADGKEVEGFAVLAQRRGAKAVVASLWPVADVSTQRLMQTFYRVRDARPETQKAEALRQAQLSLLRGPSQAEGSANKQQPGGTTAADDPSRGLKVVSNSDSSRGVEAERGQHSFAHPYYWAPFILIGNWR